jgi:hypothetical protein
MYFELIIFIRIFLSFGTNHLSFHYFLRGNSLWYTSALDYEHVSRTNYARKPRFHCTINKKINKINLWTKLPRLKMLIWVFLIRNMHCKKNSINISIPQPYTSIISEGFTATARNLLEGRSIPQSAKMLQVILGTDRPHSTWTTAPVTIRKICSANQMNLHEFYLFGHNAVCCAVSQPTLACCLLHASFLLGLLWGPEAPP